MPQPARWQAVLFDFDYTLGDSSPAAVECMRYALARLDLPDVDPITCAGTVGLSLPETFRVLAGPEHADLTDAFYALFMDKADEIMVPWTSIYPYTRPTLARLRAAGLRTAIVSNKQRFRIEAILALHDLSDMVDVIVGGEDVTAPKPDPDALHVALRLLGLDAPEACYVGDNVVDARAAQAAGVPFIGVTSGHTTAETLAAWPHLAIVADAGEVPDTLSIP